MDIIVKNKNRDADREVFTLDARKRLKQEAERFENALAGKPSQAIMGGGSFKLIDRIQDPDEYRKRAKLYRRDYERGKPIGLDPQSRNELWKKAKRLKDQFVVGMVSKKDMHPVSHRQIVKDGKVKTAVVANYDKLKQSKAIERNQAWLKKNQTKLSEFKRIMRVLEPDNPSIANVERFRK